MKWLWCTQVLAIVRLEMRKTFFSRRGLWVYLLAFAPLLLFMGHVVSSLRINGTSLRGSPESIRSPARPLRPSRSG